VTAAIPTSTYRIQVTPDRPLAAVVELVDHLAGLGVSHLYLSPLLTSTPGSTHGYDVIDHHSIDRELGGIQGLRSLHQAVGARGMGLILDIVPNHMALPVPETANGALWSVLRDGSQSTYARWFDVDWSAQRPLLLAVLGRRIDQCLDDGSIRLDADGGPDGSAVLRYGDHVFPVRAGTEHLPLVALLDAQHYRLAYWGLADEELNYRRFFDIDTLVGLRVEDPVVFADTHALIVSLVREGVVFGLRVDHPDGLADPRGYLSDLARATDHAWVVVEKVLGPDEELPADWSCAGTTGYEAAAHVGAVFVDPGAALILTEAFGQATGDDRPFASVAAQSRRDVLTGLLATEVDRLAAVAKRICDAEVRLRDHSLRGITQALVELLVAVPVYRVYVHVGDQPQAAAVQVLSAAARVAAERVPERAPEVELLRDLALGRHGTSSLKDQFVRRFQQTCGPAMAKGVEDTACFRWFPLVSLADVGFEPDVFGIADEQFHTWAAHRARTFPQALNAGSTHDGKRSEDVRARLAVLTEIPRQWLVRCREWSQAVGPLTTADGERDGRTEWLLWQSLVGAWPISSERLVEHLTKAVREAKLHTSWSVPDERYERHLGGHVRGVLSHREVISSVAETVEGLRPGFVTNVLGQRALSLFLPGVPDIYQGCEIVSLALTDPDNRRPPDYVAVLAAMGRRMAAVPDPAADLDAAKAHLTATGLALRAARPELVQPSQDYRPVRATGAAAGHVIGFARGDLCVAVSRWALRLSAAGGFGDTTAAVPAGAWRDALTGASLVSSGSVRADELFASWPVSVLVQDRR
jgi:(1->4)-alpha-D-glucan 1-alpha-D-glucosylmutase